LNLDTASFPGVARDRARSHAVRRILIHRKDRRSHRGTLEPPDSLGECHWPPVAGGPGV